MENTLTDDLPRCSACGNLYNEASGHRHSEKTVLCGVCARDFKDWWKGMTNRRWGKVKFYDFTETSRNKTKGDA
jgi:hydrogenase maturation factor HypF (carbamoyltransferase family)